MLNGKGAGRGRLSFQLLSCSLAVAASMLIGVSTVSSVDMTNTLKPYTIVAFGTSLTARAAWPDDLGRALATCDGRPVVVTKIARSGETTRWGLTQIDTIAAARPDVVLIELYANDAALNRFISVRQSRVNIASILTDLRARLPSARLAVMAMSPQLGLKSYIRPFVDDFIDAHFEEARKRSVEHIDFRTDWKTVPSQRLQEVILDGAHPDPGFASQLMAPRLTAFFQTCNPSHP